MDRRSVNYPIEYSKELDRHINSVRALAAFLTSSEVIHAADHYRDALAYEGTLDTVCDQLGVKRYDAIVDRVAELQSRTDVVEVGKNLPTPDPKDPEHIKFATSLLTEVAKGMA
ncbi:hypothetical protein BH762_gp101 [Gordonia phage OneUp]|uniref:Uncharacterized protein n=1 Tax=Gordonia phage OneUp TaxID=1838074 RepID=A0A160DEV9_9CAUD|nr:hypothetical protein BH762_gp101 [Gordonia phage OneUp]ANA86418.1 hypothetical protein PBI_ONEUP_84 [Gordonia phage OneUp]